MWIHSNIDKNNPVNTSSVNSISHSKNKIFFEWGANNSDNDVVWEFFTNEEAESALKDILTTIDSSLIQSVPF
jgi:hypothetical protein